MEKVLKMFSKLVLVASTGAVSGASRWGDYQPKESVHKLNYYVETF